MKSLKFFGYRAQRYVARSPRARRASACCTLAVVTPLIGRHALTDRPFIASLSSGATPRDWTVRCSLHPRRRYERYGRYEDCGGATR